MKIPKILKNKFDRNIVVNIINSQVNDNNFDVKTLIKQLPGQELKHQPSPCDFIDMGQEGNRQHIEAMKQLEDQKKQR